VVQGTADNFLSDKQLLPDALVSAAAENNAISFSLAMNEGYDHSYYYIATFIDDHIAFHQQFLSAQP
jgi:S-formylglutathione hydrolase FrmB